jgi:5-methylthioadenosine/S-adenosylhomocysteine deaminase
MKKLIIPKDIVTVDSEERILRDHLIVIDDGIIREIVPKNTFDFFDFDGEVNDYSKLTLIPGFVQTHVHLCQTLFRGLADDLELLDWLHKRIFPFENAHNKQSLSISSKLGIYELQLSGTTTILDMGTINHQEVIFEEIINSKIRAIAGKCLVDQNQLFPEFKESTEDALNSSIELANEFHNRTERIKYAFTPRFVLSCTEGLLKDSYELLKDYQGSMYHTHSSENENEVEAVRRKTGKENIQYFNDIGVLGDHTILAHCIHVNEDEIESLKSTNTRVAHCPSSNLKLGSGVANIPNYIKNDISVSLGADGAPCNNELNIFTEMRLASLIQKPIHGPAAMDSKTVFKLSNIEGAKALNLDNEIGSIEVGKKADFVLMDLDRFNNPYTDNEERIYSSIVYSSSKNDVIHVMIGGDWVVKNSESLIYDEEQLLLKGKEELNKLLSRMGS